MDVINKEHKRLTGKIDPERLARGYRVVQRMKFKDGTALSIQANRAAYCYPREDDAWPYQNFEVGSSNEPLLVPYREDPTDSMSIHSNVSLAVLLEIAEKHDGIK